MRAYRATESLLLQLWERLSHCGALFAPVRADDGVTRLQPVTPAQVPATAGLPMLSLKKLVLPASDLLWSWQGDGYRSPLPPSAQVVVAGVAPCDLYALAYLDLVFSDDALYQARRQRLLVIGAPCRPTAQCACPRQTAPPSFDLFVADGRIWSGSEQGDASLAPLGPALVQGGASFPEYYWGGQRPALPVDLANRFAHSAASPLWAEAAARCLACGACSALCPTCACYDVIDAVPADGRVERRREWDNCFFPDHALVAGGHDFRPDRGARLRFRFEHKYLGFGPLRGIASCVGCGRCARGCPVGIDLSVVLARLTAGEGG